MKSRTSSRGLICNSWVLVFVGSLVVPTGHAKAEGNKLTLSELRAQRKVMAQRKRRIIYNNDGDDIGGHGGTTPKGGYIDTPEELLELRTTAILGSQVDTIFYHSTYGMKLFFEDSAFKTIYEYPDKKGLASRNCKALIANYGKDALDVMVDFGRKNDLEIFYSNRMNDNHDWYFPEILSAIKVKHPEYTIGHAQAERERSPEETLALMRKGKGPETALNYGLQIIRDLTVDAMREVCRNHDVDGIDLDYFRFFRVVAPDNPVPQEYVELLNDMMRKMRAMTEEEGLRRGRPILIAARGIIDPDYSLGYGLDVNSWLKEDLIDILMPIHIVGKRGSLKSFIELAQRYNVQAYPCLRENWKESNWPTAREEAMFRFTEGADGITTFNRFDPTHRLWQELGDPETLRNLLEE